MEVVGLGERRVVRVSVLEDLLEIGVGGRRICGSGVTGGSSSWGSGVCIFSEIEVLMRGSGVSGMIGEETVEAVWRTGCARVLEF